MHVRSTWAWPCYEGGRGAAFPLFSAFPTACATRAVAPSPCTTSLAMTLLCYELNACLRNTTRLSTTSTVYLSMRHRLALRPHADGSDLHHT